MWCVAGITGEKRKTALYAPTECDAFRVTAGWRRVACGQHHSLALDAAGQVYCVGRCEYGRSVPRAGHRPPFALFCRVCNAFRTRTYLVRPDAGVKGGSPDRWVATVYILYIVIYKVLWLPCFICVR